MIATRLDVPLRVMDQLRGQEFGLADGLPWNQVINTFGGTPTQAPDLPIAEGAESWNDYASRVLGALDRILRDHLGQRIILVGHGKTVALAGARLAGELQPALTFSGYLLEHGAFSRWTVDHRTPLGWKRLR
jgi:2,3-bisphosphoglycerate-dependent phosphoglycerate mutase